MQNIKDNHDIQDNNEERPLMPLRPARLNQPIDMMPPMAMGMPNMPMTPIIGPNYSLPSVIPYNSPFVPQAVPYPPNIDNGLMPSAFQPACDQNISLDQNGEPPVLTDVNYLQGYLKTIKGKYIRVDFLIGSNTFLDKEGVLTDVGVDHIILREPQTDDLVIADLYSIKFVKVFE
ncbi:hypothetical protein [Abyssisolibacter fermentans]|uniref:hypothetical protein n=1 Tax=Abyssisolibacter fermentans TaxID=1766203 RepID=UPI000833947B|nr:hypothetical protein [Abyssisolibacter fermentans]